MSEIARILSPVPFALEDEEFGYFQSVIYELAGIRLADFKRDLVQFRLGERVSALRLGNFLQYRRYLEALDPLDPEWQHFINALTTNKTDWFREPAHFDLLVQDIERRLRERPGHRISIWSAACSTGEEPYSISLALQKAFGPDVPVRIFSTDIDTQVLRVAANGVYPKTRLDQVPSEYRAGFAGGSGEIADWMKIRTSVRRSVSFQAFNLMSERFPWTEEFDVIFCRNVMIYFTREAIARLVENLRLAAKPGGLLLIGHSESLQNVEHSWRYLQPSVFRKD